MFRPLLGFAAVAILAGAALLSRPSAQEPPPPPTSAMAMRAVGAVHPRLAPDGKSIVFAYQGSIWRIPAEGGTMKRIAAGAGFAVEPCWSPDGKRIAFLLGKGFGSGELRLIDAGNGAALPLPKKVFGSGK